MNHKMLSGLIILILAGNVFADLSVPWERRVPITTILTCESDLSNYQLYLMSEFGQEKPKRLSLLQGTKTVIELANYRGSCLYAFPKQIPLEAPSREILLEASNKHKAKVKSIHLGSSKYFHKLDFRDETEREVAIRVTADELEFVVLREPTSSGSNWFAVGVGLLFCSLAIYLGFRLKRRISRKVVPRNPEAST